MARPRKLRRVCYFPEIRRFSPCGADKQGKPITMTVDEFESVRLIDWEGLSQEECARRMGVARTTVQMIYVSARRKLAAMLVEGVSLSIRGGEYRLCDGRETDCGNSGCLMRKCCSSFQKPKGEWTMRIAVTYEEGEIFQHFGHTERFKLYEIENGEVVSAEVIDTAGAGHEALALFLAERGVQTLICGGIGSGAVQALGMAGIQVYGGITGLADYAVEALIRGVLAHDPNPNCKHHEEEGHECCHGEGQSCCHE